MTKKLTTLFVLLSTLALVLVACYVFYPAKNGPGYKRSPDEWLVKSPLSFTASYTDFQRDANMTPDYLVAWGLNIYDTDDETIYQTESIPMSEKSHTFKIDLPERNIMAVGFYGCSKVDICQSQGTILEGSVMYEGPPKTIFKVDKNGADTSNK